MSPIDLVGWIDRQIQRGVDQAAIALMHRGVPKSRIQYGVRLAALGCLLAHVPIFIETAPVIVAAAVSAGIGVAVVVLGRMAKADYRLDVRAEERGALTGRDRPRSPFWKLWNVGFFVNAILSLGPPSIAFWCCEIVESYLYAVPRIPPPRAIRLGALAKEAT